MKVSIAVMPSATGNTTGGRSCIEPVSQGCVGGGGYGRLAEGRRTHGDGQRRRARRHRGGRSGPAPDAVGRRGHRAPTLRSGGGKAPPPPAGRGVARDGRRAHRRRDRQGRRRARARAARSAVLSERSRSPEPDGGGGHGDQEARTARGVAGPPRRADRATLPRFAANVERWEWRASRTAPEEWIGRDGGDEQEERVRLRALC